MARHARWIDTSLIHEKRNEQKSSTKVDDDIQARIRSLLISQNKHHNPRAPSPSAQHAFSPYDSEEDDSGFSPQLAASYLPCAAMATVKLVDIEPKNLSMMDNRFDGSASLNIDYLHTRPSQPEPENQTRRDHHKSESSATISSFRPPSRATSQLSKNSTNSHILIHNIRTLLPASSHPKEKLSESEGHNMPGSYISEIDMMPDGRTTKEVSVSKPTRFDPGSNPETQSRAIEALKKARDFDKSEKNPRPKPAHRREPSQTSFRSTNSTLDSLHLLKLATGYTNTSHAVEPVLTPSVSQGHSYNEKLETPQPIPIRHRERESAKSSSAENSSADAILKQDLSNDRGLSNKHNTSKAVDLPIRSLRSSTCENVDQSYDHFPAAGGTTKPKLESLTDQRPTPLKKTLPLLDQDEEPIGIHPSSFLMINNQANKMNIDGAISEAMPAKSLDSDDSSAIVQKLSKFGRAVTGLSDTSLLPTLPLPFLRSPVNDKEEDGMSGKGHLQELSHSPSKSRSENSKGFSDNANLVKDLGPNSEDGVRPKKHWIQQLLSRKSSNSLTKTYPNLTTRSSGPFVCNTKDTNQQETEKLPSNVNLNADVDASTENRLIDEKMILDERQRKTEPFTGVIENLEGILNEALTLARRAADPAIHEISPSSSSYSINRGSRLVHNSYNSSMDSDDMSSRSGDLDVEQPKITLPALYNYLHRDYRDQEKFLKAWDSWSNQHVGAEKPKSHSIVQDSSVEVHSVSESALQPKYEGDADDALKSLETRDWAIIKQPPHTPIPKTSLSRNLTLPRKPGFLKVPLKEQRGFVVRENKSSSTFASETAVPLYNRAQMPRIQPRSSSAGLRTIQPQNEEFRSPKTQFANENYSDVDLKNLRPSGLQYRTETQQTIASRPNRGYSFTRNVNHPFEDELPSLHEQPTQNEPGSREQGSPVRNFSLTGRRHHSLRETHGFSLSRSHRRAPIARDWRTSRKRYVATVACVNTALMGLIIGIYAGEVPAIQYAIADEHHYAILGNVVFFIGLAITTASFWPLPLLHGRKPYTIAALALLLPLQFPQATAVGTTRSPNVSTYRVGLLLSRSLSGLIMGFANINFKTTLLDLFGASLQSAHPHQETVNNNDVRRHGGGMGVWLGIWTWCFIGSIGVGFLIGAILISGLNVSWGFWLTIIFTAFTLILNVLVPEVRRSSYRRSMAEVQNGDDVSRRIARGEIKMHIDATGPKWWWEEVVAGHKLCLRMLKQPGFTILALYMGWIYGQIVMVIVVSTLESCSMAMADVLPASGSAYIKILSVSSTIRGPLCCCGTTGCFACDTISKSLSFQSIKKAVSTDRQHDGTRPGYMDVSSCQTSFLHDFAAIRRSSFYFGVWWDAYSLYGTYILCWSDRLSLQSRHCGV